MSTAAARAQPGVEVGQGQGAGRRSRAAAGAPDPHLRENNWSKTEEQTCFGQQPTRWTKRRGDTFKCGEPRERRRTV